MYSPACVRGNDIIQPQGVKGTDICDEVSPLDRKGSFFFISMGKEEGRYFVTDLPLSALDITGL